MNSTALFFLSTPLQFPPHGQPNHGHVGLIIGLVAAVIVVVVGLGASFYFYITTDDASDTTSTRSSDFELEEFSGANPVNFELEEFSRANPISSFVQVDGDEVQCGICIERVESGVSVRRLVQCGHAFHVHCVDKWVVTGGNSAGSCPLCRRPLV